MSCHLSLDHRIKITTDQHLQTQKHSK
uniref:Uncharacterized protein n=1 Tax=Anguilla anguilla TaxID=7936 RepID=A0A0E9UX57_ANGAN